jgi:hypothetical protein
MLFASFNQAHANDTPRCMAYHVDYIQKTTYHIRSMERMTYRYAANGDYAMVREMQNKMMDYGIETQIAFDKNFKEMGCVDVQVESPRTQQVRIDRDEEQARYARQQQAYTESRKFQCEDTSGDALQLVAKFITGNNCN